MLVNSEISDKVFSRKEKNNNCQHITPVFENVESRFYNCIHWIASQWAYFSTSTNFRCLNEETSNQFGLVPSNKRTTRLNRHGLCKGTSVMRCWMLLRQKSKSPPQLLGVDYIIPSTIKLGILLTELFKTGQIIPWGSFEWWFCHSNTVLPFSFLFISVESLKNHSK